MIRPTFAMKICINNLSIFISINSFETLNKKNYFYPLKLKCRILFIYYQNYLQMALCIYIGETYSSNLHNLFQLSKFSIYPVYFSVLPILDFLLLHPIHFLYIFNISNLFPYFVTISVDFLLLIFQLKLYRIPLIKY